MSTISYALQLYTVRDHMERDPARTLKEVKAMGYDHVETAGLAGLSSKEFRRLLDEAGLTAISGHVGIDALAEDVDAVIEMARVLGQEYVVVPWAGGEQKSNWETWAQYGREMEAAGFALKEHGVTLCYHNHAHEYETINGETALDIIFATAEPEALCVELDVYWTRFAGFDPVEEINKYAGRLPLIHLKDMTSGDPPTFAELGKGILDWERIMAAAKAAGAIWYIVEQDICPADSLESARISAEFVKNL